MPRPSLLTLALVAAATTPPTAAQETTPTDCPSFEIPASFKPISTLPDPFLSLSGTRVSTAEEWACRREEIKSLIQTYELGPKPPPPSVSATISDDTISITCAADGKSITFTATISKPSGPGPFPAMIGLGGTFLPTPPSVATISYNNEDIALTNPRGQGKFYDLYGSAHEAGGLMAWAWGTSRIIDALESLGSEATGIDPTRIGVTGCSRNGKGAMISGAFDDRIALTLPQEGGSGGPGCWRLAADMKVRGKDIEDAAQIVTGDGWFSTAFEAYVNDVDVLPHDHHMLGALVAPRGFLVIENSGIDYLGPFSSFGCMMATGVVYEAFGEEVGDRFGFSQNSHGSSHCQLPGSQDPEVLAFMERFLVGDEGAETDVWVSDGQFDFQAGDWIEWEAPDLSG